MVGGRRCEIIADRYGPTSAGIAKQSEPNRQRACISLDENNNRKPRLIVF
jgi:hypothetical protein